MVSKPSSVRYFSAYRTDEEMIKQHVRQLWLKGVKDSGGEALIDDFFRTVLGSKNYGKLPKTIYGHV